MWSTRELWEAINTFWHDVRDLDANALASAGRTAIVDQIKLRSHQVRGAIAGTMIQDDLFRFMRLGTFIERADSTARILDVKYHLILPEGRRGRRSRLLSMDGPAASRCRHGSYRRVFGTSVSPISVAELLTLRPEMPRSIRHCYDQIMEGRSGGPVSGLWPLPRIAQDGGQAAKRTEI